MIGLWDRGDGPLYRQLAEAIGALIDAGRLVDAERLPPERVLGAELSISRGTVVSAYALLAERGQVERVQGRGTSVVGQTGWSDEPVERIGDPLYQSTPRSIDLLLAVPRILERVLDLVGSVNPAAHSSILDDFDPAGNAQLRSRIAELMTADGLTTRSEQVLVSGGAQQGIFLCTMALVEPGDVVLCEEVSWPGLVDSVHRFGGRTYPVPMDEHGIDVDQVRQAVERLRPSMIAVNPHNHNPTSTRLSEARRIALAKIADDYSVPIVEDRVLARLSYDGQTPPPLAVHAEKRPGLCITIDSITKVAWPGLRLGWVRADSPFIDRLRSIRATIDLYTPIPSQLAALAVLDDFDGVTADRINELLPKRDLVLDLLTELLPEWRVAPPRGGLVAWVELPRGSAAAFSDHAARQGVLVANGRQFGDADDTHLRIPFTASEAEIAEGMLLLAEAWRTFDPAARPPVDVPTLV